MKYETPELTALTPAINAVQVSKGSPDLGDSPPEPNNETIGAYADWE